MLRFIIHYAFLRWLLNLISIHLMLRFICVIAVIINLCSDISIHLMLRFIPDGYGIHIEAKIFQYISCYGLSKNTDRTLTRKLNFNTSHVTVYLDVEFLKYRMQIDFNTSHVTVYLSNGSITLAQSALFQYISCYGLSALLQFFFLDFPISIHLMLRFIENGRITNGFNIRISIHLMLRFIIIFGLKFFNPIIISIHLMLRFIADATADTGNFFEFQYISCYGLS